MRILVTGGAGFVGRPLVAHLIKMGHKLIVVDDLSNLQSYKPKNCDFIKGDISNKRIYKLAFRNIDICIALASRKGAIGFVNRYPTDILRGNTSIYNTTFEQAAANKIKKLIFVSSSMVFEGAFKFPTNEDDLKNCILQKSGFGLSKYLGEIYCKAYRREFNLNYVILRPSNIYGPGEKPEKIEGDSHVIPDLYKKLKKQPNLLKIFGSGKQTRCFIHVKDLVEVISKIVETKDPRILNNDFNIGGIKEYSVLQIAKLINRILGNKNKINFVKTQSYDNDVNRQYMKCDKIKNILQWKPKISFEDGLKEMIRWLDDNYKE
jgi:UDP-glucose 4-epimerase